MTISSAQLLCIFETGDATSGTFGRPMRVSVSGFSYTVNTQLSVRFIIVNPDETFPQQFKVSVKAFGGSSAAAPFSGRRYYGFAQLEQAFLTTTTVN